MRLSKVAIILGGGSIMLAPFLVFAQPEVVEIGPGSASAPRTGDSSYSQDSGYDNGNYSSSSSSVAASGQDTLYLKLQRLEQEVQDLRGIVEEQANELRKLKQQQVDDYVNIDSRLTAMGGGAAAASATRPSASTAPSAATSASSPTSRPSQPASGAEKAKYDAAYQKLKQRDIEGAVAGFKGYLVDYPQGEYAPNAHYWLGEIYLLKNKPSEARTEFAVLVDSYPDHNKTPVATYKLGTAYYQLGDKQKARSLLEKAAAGSGESAKMAQKDLNTLFGQ